MLKKGVFVSYSHGLDEIYAIKNLDLSTIRPMSSSPPIKEEEKLVEEMPSHAPFIPYHDVLDIGDEHKASIEPFVFMEPLQNLLLSQQAERFLLEQGMKNIGALYHTDLNGLSSKGLGQGHFDEIHQKLTQFTQNTPTCPSGTFDAASLLRFGSSLTDFNSAYALAQEFGLESYLRASNSKIAEAKRLTDYEKKRVLENVDRTSTFASQINRVLEACVKPWVRKRGGLTDQEEIIERLERINVSTLPIDKLIQMARIDFGEVFSEVEHGVFAYDNSTAADYLTVKSEALTYFYNDSIKYSLATLSDLLSRDFAKRWLGFPEGFIEKVFNLSPSFHILQGHVELF